MPLHITTYPGETNIGPCDRVSVRVRPESGDLTSPAIGGIHVRAPSDSEIEVRALTPNLNWAIKEIVLIDNHTFIIRYYPTIHRREVAHDH